MRQWKMLYIWRSRLAAEDLQAQGNHSRWPNEVQELRAVDRGNVMSYRSPSELEPLSILSKCYLCCHRLRIHSLPVRGYSLPIPAAPP